MARRITSAWVARFNVGGENPFTAVSIATTDDDSVVAIGDIDGVIYFHRRPGPGFRARE